jgi:protoporphyrinogen oxidase
MTVDAQTGILGAGPSGLAFHLFARGDVEILEKHPHVGGHASSFIENGFTFDYGPHILFSKDNDILTFIISTLGDNVSQCRRNNKVMFKGRCIKYPFENDLVSLPLEDNFACIRNFMMNPYKAMYHEPKNMKEWFLKTFGEGICTRYLFPYNEKIWNIPVENLTMDMADRIPNPPPEDVLKSSLGYQTEGYLHQLYYHYPKHGGYQAISEAWKANASISYNTSVTAIEPLPCGNSKVTDSNGKVRQYHRIVSTIPIQEMLHILKCPIPDDIQIAIRALITNPMFIASFGIKGDDPNQYTAMYFPEPDFWVNRISYPTTFSPYNAPAHHWSIQAEITCKPNSDVWNSSNEAILAHVKQGLQTRNILPSNEEIVLERIDRQEYAYVVYDTDYQKHAKKIRAWFASLGIHLLGRFSYFEYINVDMAVHRAMALAMRLNGENQDMSVLKQSYLDYALDKLSRHCEKDAV